MKEKISDDEFEVNQIPFVRKNYQQETPKKSVQPPRKIADADRKLQESQQKFFDTKAD